MKRGVAWIAALVGILAIASQMAAARTHAFYYDATEGHGTAVVLTNLLVEETSAELYAYDSSGNEVAAVSVVLAGFASEAIFLEELVDGASGRTWGLARVETDGRIALAGWIHIGQQWLAIENVSTPVAFPGEGEYSGYWFAANYANTANRTMGLSVINLSDESAVGEIYIYDAEGNPVSARPFELTGRSAAFILLSDELEVGENMWGLIDVRSDRLILLACEYMDASGTLIDVDVVSRFYVVEP